MARAQRLDYMRTRALQLADMEVGNYVSTTEANNVLNGAIAEAYDWILSVAPTSQFTKDGNFTTVAGTIAYSLPADFRSEIAVYALDQLTDGTRRPIDDIGSYERAYYKAPTGAYTLLMEYVPAPTILTADSDTFDGISGYEELPIAIAARNFLTKEESDISAVQLMITELRARITSKFRRSKGPRYLLDVDAVSSSVLPTNVGVRGYRLRAGNIEFYESVIPLLVSP